MKRFLTLWMLLAAFLPMAAQDGLHINGIFNGPYRNRKDATEVLLKGARLRPYRLTYFRSLSFLPSAAELADLERRVKTDANRAVDRESATKGGHLYYGIFQLAPAGKHRRFIFFRNNGLSRNGKKGVTLIYMEGNTTLKDLKKDFTN